MIRIVLALAFLLVSGACVTQPISGEQKPASGGFLVLMTDFSLKDGAVSAMKGVAYDVSPSLVVSDLTHEVPPYNIWEGAYRLSQTYKYWPSGTVFVSVVDPGVGTDRRSAVALSKSGHYFVGPDNGLLTLIEEDSGLVSVRVIDETKQRLKGSSESYTFHGRDLYAYVGARIASGALKYDDAGEVLKGPPVRIAYQKAEAKNGEIKGMIAILDPNYGNVWTNIPKKMAIETFPGAQKSLRVRIMKGKSVVFDDRVPLVETFGAVKEGRPLLYFNSLLNLSIALNMADFAKKHKISSGPEWTMIVSK